MPINHLQDLPLPHHLPSLTFISILRCAPATQKDLEPLGVTICSPDSVLTQAISLSENTFPSLLPGELLLILQYQCSLTLRKLSEPSGRPGAPLMSI